MLQREYEQAIRRIQGVTDDITSFLKDQNARRLVVTVQVKLFDNQIDVVSPTRTVQKYGKVRVISDNLFGSGHSTEKCVLVLMNDMVLYGDAASKLSKGKVRAVLQLPGMYAEDMKVGATLTRAYEQCTRTALRDMDSGDTHTTHLTFLFLRRLLPHLSPL